MAGRQGRRASWVAVLAALSLAPSAVHAAEPADGPAPADAPNGVSAYPASFFAPMGLETAYDMVLRLPGFAFDDGSAVRGFGGAAGNVLIDGQRPASKTDDLIAILRRIPVAQVERIDLIRGGAPGVDMQGKTIVANVVRRKDAGFTGAAVVSAYMPSHVPVDPQLRLEGNWKGDGRTLEASLFGARYHDDTQARGLHTILAPNGQALDSSQMRYAAPLFRYLGVVAYETPLYGGRLRVNLTLEDQPYRLNDVDNFVVAGRQQERLRQDQTDGELGLRYSRDLTPRLALEAFGLQHLNTFGAASIFQTAGDDEDFSVHNLGGESIARGVLHWRPSGNLTVDAGGEFAFNWLRTRTSFSDNGVAIQVPAGRVRVQEQRAEGFTTATWRPSAALVVEAGLRVEHSTISSSGDVALSRTLTFSKPRLAATWSPDANDQLRLRVEREVGQLDFNNFAANGALNGAGVAAGNPNLAPQTDWAFEAAYERHFWKDGVVSLTLRRLVLQDVVDRVPVTGPSGVFDEPGNIGGGRENDVIAAFSVPLDRIGVRGATLRGQGTWRSSRVDDPTTGDPRAISGQHPLDAELHFAQNLPAWKMRWGIDTTIAYRERYFRFNEIDTIRNGTFNLVFFEYKPRRDLTAHFEIANTSRRAYRNMREVFSGPRDIAPPAFTDLQSHTFGTFFFARIRKTF